MLVVPVKSPEEKRKNLIRSMNDAIELREKIRHDDMLRKVYYDFDFDGYIDRCREMLSDYNPDQFISLDEYNKEELVFI